MESAFDELLARARADPTQGGVLLEVAQAAARSGIPRGERTELLALFTAAEGRLPFEGERRRSLAEELFAAVRVLGLGLGDPRHQIGDAFWSQLQVAPDGSALVLVVPQADAWPVRVLDPVDLSLRWGTEDWFWNHHLAFPAPGGVLRKVQVSRSEGRRPRPGQALEIADWSLGDGALLDHRTLDLGEDTELLGLTPAGDRALLRWSGALTLLELPEGEPSFFELPDLAPRLFGRGTFDPTGRRALVHGFRLPEGAEAYSQAYYLHQWGTSDHGHELFLLDGESGATRGRLERDGPWLEQGSAFLASEGALREVCGWSPDGTRLAWVEARDRSQALVVRDGDDLGAIAELEVRGHRDPVPPPWNIHRGGETPRLPTPRWVAEDRLVLPEGAGIRSFSLDLDGLREEAPLSEDRVWVTGWAPLGASVAVSTPWSLEVLRAADGVPVHRLEGHRAPLETLEALPGRGALVTVDRLGELRVWNTETGACAATVDLARLQVPIAWSTLRRWRIFPFSRGDTELVLVQGNGGGLVLDPGTGDVAHRVPPPRTSGNDSWLHLHPHPDGDAVLALDFDGSLEILELETGESRPLLEAGSDRRACGVAGRGRWAVVLGEETVRTVSLQDATPGPEWDDLGHWGRGCPHWVQDLPGEAAFLTQGGWGYPQRCPFDGGPEETYLRDRRGTDAASVVAFSPDGGRFATLPVEPGRAPTGRLQVWDRRAGRALRFTGVPTNPAAGIAWSLCGRFLFHAEVAHVAMLEVDGDGWTEFPEA